MPNKLTGVAGGNRMERALHARIILSGKTSEKTKKWIGGNSKQLRNILRTHHKI